MANILLLEDYASLQKVYAKILEAAGHTVWVAENGEVGLIMAAEHPVDLILVDVLMPVMEGFEFLQTYNLKKHPGVKAVVLTNINDNDLMKKFYKLGASNYIIKANTEPKDFLQIISDTLSE